MSDSNLPLNLSSSEEQDSLNLSESLTLDDYLDLGDSLDLSDSLTLDDDLTLDDFGLDDIDLDDDDTDLSGTLLLSQQEDIISALLVSKSAILNAYQTVFAQENGDDKKKYIIPREEFQYMPAPVYQVFYEILLDTATKQEFENMNVGEAFDHTADTLYDATAWTPRLHLAELQRSFQLYFEQFRKISKAVLIPDNADIRGLLDEDSLSKMLQLIDMNSLPFMLITSLFEDTTTLPTETELEHNDFGELMHMYMEQHDTQTLTVGLAHSAAVELLTSDDACALLGITQDDAIAFPLGELVRRLVVSELDSGELYPTGFRSGGTAEVATLLKALAASIERGSASAEILLLVGNALAVKEHGVGTNTAKFLSGIINYFQAFIQCPASINPILYSSILKSGEKYNLNYVVNGETKVLVSKDVLCNVVGSRTLSYAIPTYYVDQQSSCIVMAPKPLVEAMRQLTCSGHMKIGGSARYIYTPTLSWVAKCSVITQEDNIDVIDSVPLMEQGENQLLSVLLSYTNNFTMTDTSPRAIMVTAPKKCIAFAVQRTDTTNASNSRSYPLARLELLDDQGNVSDTATSGSMYRDPEDDTVIISYTKGTAPDTLILNKADYEETYLDSLADKETAEVSWDYLIASSPMNGQTSPHPHRSIQKVAKQLCSLNAICYEEELDEVQHILGRELFYLLDIYELDSLLAYPILLDYKEFIAQQENEGDLKNALDACNFSSLKEVIDICLGIPNEFTNISEWNTDCKDILTTVIKKAELTAHQFAHRLEEAPLETIALQVLSKNELSRDSNISSIRALHYIDPIASSLQYLEDCMIILRVLAEIGAEVATIFRKKSALLACYEAPISIREIDSAEKTLTKLSQKDSNEEILPLTRAFISHTPQQNEPLLKYFILERNLYGMLTVLTDPAAATPAPAGAEAGASQIKELLNTLLKSLLDDLGIGSTSEFSKLSEAEFNKLISKDKIAQVYIEHKQDAIKLVQCGLLSEQYSNVTRRQVTAYDLMVSCGGVLCNSTSKESSITEAYKQDFFNYAGSLIISYLPVTGDAQNAIDGGIDRATAFYKYNSEFYSNRDITFISEYDLTDIRTQVGLNSSKDEII